VKILILCLSLVSASAFATKIKLPKQMGNKAVKIVEDKKPDCDEKAKKPIEIKPENVSLGGLSGTTGCSLDDVKSH